MDRKCLEINCEQEVQRTHDCLIDFFPLPGSGRSARLEVRYALTAARFSKPRAARTAANKRETPSSRTRSAANSGLYCFSFQRAVVTRRSSCGRFFGYLPVTQPQNHRISRPDYNYLLPTRRPSPYDRCRVLRVVCEVDCRMLTLCGTPTHHDVVPGRLKQFTRVLEPEVECDRM